MIQDEMLKAGLCVLPAEKDKKRPAIWKWREYQTRLPAQSELHDWAWLFEHGCCIVAGAVSGGLECIDFDSGGIAFRPWQKMISPELGGKLVCEQTPSGGFHVVFRSSCPEGNQKLALDADKKVLVETRGEGGLFLCDPTPGYKLVQGDWMHVPTITADERASLLDAARSFDYKQPHVEKPAPKPLAIAPRELESPADVYARYGDIRSVLEKHGWTLVHEGRQQLWRRPGKNEGTSATFNGTTFFVFSTNAYPFEGNKGYSKFSVLALLDFGGDQSAAAVAVREEMLAHGYTPGQAADADTMGVDIAAVVSASAEKLAEPDSTEEPQLARPTGDMSDEIYECGGFIESLTAYTCRTTPYPNRPIAFAGAIAMMSMLASRRFQTVSGLSPNVYILGLADSGSGKDRPRQVNFELAACTGMMNCVGDSFVSGAGLEDSLVSTPTKLFQADEISFLFASLRENDRVANEMVSTILKLYSASSSVLVRRAMAARAKKDQPDIEKQVWRPCFVLFGTATPDKFYNSLTADSLENGLAGRVLLFEGAPRKFVPGASSGEQFPGDLLDAISEIRELDATGGVITNGRPTPIRVQESVDASHALNALAADGDAKWAKASLERDVGAMSIWARVHEKAYKLSVLRAVSRSRTSPRIDVADVDWGREIATRSAVLLLDRAKAYVADDEFDKKRLRVLRAIRENAGEMSLRDLSRKTHFSKKVLQEVIDTLVDSRQIEIVSVAAKGRPMIVVKLVS